MFEAAVQFIKSSQFQKAEEVLLNIIYEQPGDFDANHMLGVVYSELGKTELAENHFKLTSSIDPNHPPLYQNWGLFLSKQRRFEEAIDKFNMAIRLAPNFPPVYSYRGNALKELGRYREAIIDHNRAINLAPQFFGFYSNRGNTLREQKEYTAALTDYDRAIQLNPNYADAFNGRGNVFCDLKRYDEAFAAYDKALSIKPDLENAWLGRGNVFCDLKRYDEAFAAYDKALSIKPDLENAWLGRGHAAGALGRHDEALAAYDKALSIKPDLENAWLGRGHAAGALGRHDEALAAYDKALSIKPDLENAWLGRGHAAGALGRHDEALAAYDRAVALNPTLAEVWLGRGHVFVQLHKYGEALAAYDRAAALKPYLAEPWLARGLALGIFGNHQAALADFDRALALDQNLAWASIGRGNALLQLQQYDNALAAYDRALALNGDFAEAWFGRADVFLHLRQYEKALAAFDRAMVLKPDIEFAPGARLHMKLSLSHWTNLEAEVSDLVAAVRAGKPAASPFVFIGVSSSAADQLTCAKSGLADKPLFPVPERGEIYSHDRIRIGYFSGDLRTHPVAQLMVGVFERHHKSRYEITAFSYGPDDGSDLRHRIKSATEDFIDVRPMSDGEIAESIRRREIDVLVDLTGWTLHSRSSVLSRRVAPIQVNFLGYPGTAGVDWMDYIIADRTIIPEHHFPFYSERVVWLPDSYQPNAYQRNDDKGTTSRRPPTRAECGLPESGFVFCCFNNTYKITPAIFDVWMRLLRAIPNSVLWLSQPNPTAEANLRKEAELRGVSPERLIFAPRFAEMSDHLARQRHADLFLDTLPYNAHTTASDALWAGLPVVTCLGETFAGRVAASVLKAVGLPELITTSVEDYEALALRLARDPTLLASIKAKLARNRSTHPLFDTARFTRHIEAAYTTMWRRYQDDAAPQAFAVEPID